MNCSKLLPTLIKYIRHNVSVNKFEIVYFLFVLILTNFYGCANVASEAGVE